MLELYVLSDVFVAMKSPYCVYSVSLRGLMRMFVGTMVQHFGIQQADGAGGRHLQGPYVLAIDVRAERRVDRHYEHVRCVYSA